ncbi:four helix bundle protein [Neobacillus sp. D3-1R]|uniref:four helix bundle protein n=1 Tax=Neobacillus sp. D3-1R TaxID=3445778 RepID=UPI003FA01087
MSIRKEYVGNFRDLIAYQKALLFVQGIYTLIKIVPSPERFIMNALRKASCAVVANTAEGNGNYYYGREYDHLDIAICMLAKCQSLLDILYIQGKLTREKYNRLQDGAEEISRIIGALMKRIEPYLSTDVEASVCYPMKEAKSTNQEATIGKAKVFRDAIKRMVGKLPEEESSNLVDQLIRAIDSFYENLIKSNGVVSDRRFQDLNYSLGSLSEVRSFLDISVMENYITLVEYQRLDKEAGIIQSGLIELMTRLNYKLRV